VDLDSSIIQQYTGWQWQLYKLSLPCDQWRSRRKKALAATTRNHEACLFYKAQQPLVGQGSLLIVAPRSHLDTPHSVGIRWTSYHPDAETSTWQHTTLKRDKHPCLHGIRTSNPSNWTTADPRLRPHGHWDRLTTYYCYVYTFWPSKFDIRTRDCQVFKLRQPKFKIAYLFQTN